MADNRNDQLEYQYLDWLRAVEAADQRGDSSSLVALLRNKQVPMTLSARELIAKLFQRRKLRAVSPLTEAEYALLGAVEDYYALCRRH